MGRRFFLPWFALLVFVSCQVTATAQQQVEMGGARQNGVQRGAQNAQQMMLELAPSGLPDNVKPEGLLPAGAILHVRVNSSGELLDDASKMLTPFIPEKAVGPPAEMAMQQPNPLLALIGLQTMGQPMSVEMLSGMSGIDPKRPVTLSFYLDNPQQGFVLCLPVTDLERPSALLQNMVRPVQAPQKMELNGGSALRIQSPDLEMFVVCSKDTVCVCGSVGLAQALLTAQPEQKLNTAKFITEAVKKHASDNLVVVIDPAPAKGLLPMIKGFGTIPPEQVVKWRNDILDNFGPEELNSINRQIKTQLGLRDINQLMDYVECIGLGSYEVTFKELNLAARDFKGVTFAIDLDEEFQSFEMSMFSDAIKPANLMQPLPMADVKKVVKSVPGPHDFLVLSGKAAKPQKSAYLAAVVDRIGEKMTEKKLPMDLHDNAQAAIDGYEPVIPLESKVDWSIGTSFVFDSVEADRYEEPWTYLADSWQSFAMVSLQAIPKQEKGFLESHFDEKSKTTNSNYANWQKLMQQVNADDSFFDQYSNSSAEELEDGVHKLTYEDSYRTKSGFFGYNEHELINRYFTLYRNQPDHTLLWPGGNDPELFLSFKPQPEAPAIGRLLDNAALPKDVQQIQVGRSIQGVVGFVDAIDDVESLVHKELSAYLAKVQKIGAGANDENAWMKLVPAIEAIEMPITVAHVQWDPVSKQVYLVTPAQLTFPRPKVLPAVLELLKDYRKSSPELGGAIVHHRTQEGEYDFTITQSTAGMAKLVRSVGNNVADEYLNNPQGQQRLQQLFETELDRNSYEGFRILTNSNWIFLD